MRGDDRQQAAMWSYISPEQRVPPEHPLRPIRAMVDTILADLSGEFAALYSPVGRPSIAPEKLLRALLLQVLYSVRSERLLMEQLDYNLLFRWFVGLTPSGIPRCSRRIASGCWRATSRRRSLHAPWPRPGSGDCCPTTTLRSMAR